MADKVQAKLKLLKRIAKKKQDGQNRKNGRKNKGSNK